MDNEFELIKELYKNAKEDGNEDNLNKIFEFNQRYIDKFSDYLKENKLKEKTINKHIDNIVFFLNNYLTREYVYSLFNSADSLNDFFSYFFIHKCTFANVNSMKEFVATFRYFYKYLYENKYINKETYDYTEFLFKEEKENWLEKMKEYDSKL